MLRKKTVDFTRNQSYNTKTDGGIALKDYMDRLPEAQRIAEELLSGKRYYFGDLKPSDLDKELAVVYAIFDKFGCFFY